jgi:hypothetical protein
VAIELGSVAVGLGSAALAHVVFFVASHTVFLSSFRTRNHLNWRALERSTFDRDQFSQTHRETAVYLSSRQLSPRPPPEGEHWLGHIRPPTRCSIRGQTTVYLPSRQLGQLKQTGTEGVVTIWGTTPTGYRKAASPRGGQRYQQWP